MDLVSQASVVLEDRSKHKEIIEQCEEQLVYI